MLLKLLIHPYELPLIFHNYQHNFQLEPLDYHHKMTYHQKLLKIITTQIPKRKGSTSRYTSRNLRLSYENYEEYNTSWYYRALFSANCLVEVIIYPRLLFLVLASDRFDFSFFL